MDRSDRIELLFFIGEIKFASIVTKRFIKAPGRVTLLHLYINTSTFHRPFSIILTKGTIHGCLLWKLLTLGKHIRDVDIIISISIGTTNLIPT